MAEAERRPIRIEDDEGRELDAIWSRSGKRLIFTITSRQGQSQIELRRDQVEQLGGFLSETLATYGTDR